MHASKKTTWSQEQVHLLALQAYLVFRLSLSIVPRAQEIQDQIDCPKVGDLVFELSMGVRVLQRGASHKPVPGRDLLKITDCVGHLMHIKTHGGRWNKPIDPIYTIRRLDGTTRRWHHAQFIKILEHLPLVT